MSDPRVAALAEALVHTTPRWVANHPDTFQHRRAAAILAALDNAGWRLTARDKACEGHERTIADLRAALEVRPETLPQPNGPICRKWWRLGWLSAQAVARAALAAQEADHDPR
jgi:hypothetical protein